MESTTAAMKLLHEQLTPQPESSNPPSGIFLQYGSDVSALKIHRIENKDGSLDGPA